MSDDDTTSRPLPPEEGVMIVNGENGGPIRTIRIRGQKRPTGRYTSRKSGRALRWEATHERHLMWICEADVQYVEYVEQPCRVEIYVRGERQPICYFPDFRRTHADGTIEIVETKKHPSEIENHPEYEWKLERAAEAFATRGWRFVPLTAEHDIDIQPMLQNASLISADRDTLLQNLDRLRFHEALRNAENGQLAYGKAVEILSGTGDSHDPVGRARLHALIVERRAGLNLRDRLGPDSPLQMVKAFAPHLPAEEAA